MAIMKLEVNNGAIDVVAQGPAEEVIACWAAASCRLEDVLKNKGYPNPEEMLHVALVAAERRRRRR